MSSSALPRQADLRKLAAASATVEGRVWLRELSRLQSVLMQTEGSVNVALTLSADDEGYRTVKGRIAARAVLQCQRCLGPVELDLDVPVMLAMVWAEKEIPSLPSRYDGIVVGADPVDVFDLVEEEVLLALPLVAAHEPGSCPSYSETPGIEASEPGKKNPFAVLREKGVESGD